MKINIINFSEYPGPRYKSQGNSSGEEFYIKVLNPAFAECYRNKEILEVYLDGTAGYPSSFLDEAFGELVYDFSLEVVKRFLKIKTDRYLRHESMILKETFPQWENKRIKKSKVKTTICNSSVFVLENGSIVKKDV